MKQPRGQLPFPDILPDFPGTPYDGFPRFFGCEFAPCWGTSVSRHIHLDGNSFFDSQGMKKERIVPDKVVLPGSGLPDSRT